MIILFPLWNGAFFALGFITLINIPHSMPRAMHMHNHDLARTLEWSDCDTGGVASAFHGETHTVGGTPAPPKLATGPYIVCVSCV